MHLTRKLQTRPFVAWKGNTGAAGLSMQPHHEATAPVNHTVRQDWIYILCAEFSCVTCLAYMVFVSYGPFYDVKARLPNQASGLHSIAEVKTVCTYKYMYM